jgi:hypothetical protein
MTRAFHALALASALALPSAAQIGSSVGPPVAPIGSPITITFSNDSLATLISGACPYQVYDSDGVLVHSPGCIAIAILVPPGGTLVSEWKQVDDAGQQVPPNIYRIDVQVPEIGIVSHFIQIADVDAGISFLGIPKIGTTRDFALTAPGQPGALYAMAASSSATPGIATCAGTIPLAFDAVLAISLVPTNGFFLDFVGTLDAQGRSKEPSLAIPDLPDFQGVDLNFAFLALDLAAPCPIAAISEPFALTTQ